MTTGYISNISRCHDDGIYLTPVAMTTGYIRYIHLWFPLISSVKVVYILLITYLCDACAKITIAAVKLILYYTGTSEKVVIVILLARISVAPISVTYVLVVQFVHHIIDYRDYVKWIGNGSP